jgi:hypothetical protein
MSEKINELVAEHVLGWIKPPATSVLKPMWVAPPMGTVYPKLPDFCTDMRSTEILIKKLYEKHSMQINAYDIDSFGCEIFINKTSNSMEVEAESTPLAICLAALSVYGVEIDDLVNTR